MKDARWLLALAWPFATGAFWAAFKSTRLGPWWRRGSTATTSVIAACGLLWLYAALPASTQDVPLPPSGTPLPAAPPTTPPQPSFAFVTPGVVLKQQGGDRWLMVVNHRGSEPVFNVDIELTDVPRQEAAKRANDANGVAASSAVIHFPEIDQDGRGKVFAPQFPWKPFDWRHQHYVFNIATRGGQFSEDVYVERSERGWPSAMRVVDAENNRVVLTCRDADLPSGVAPDVPTAALQCWRDVYGKTENSASASR